MFSILAKTFKTATRQQDWNAPSYWTDHRRPINRRQAEQIEAQRRLEQLRNIGMW